MYNKTEVIEDYKNGMSLKLIVEKYGMTNNTLYSIFRREKVILDRKHAPKPRQKTLLIVARLFNYELTITDIAKEFGITHQRVSQIYQAAKDANIPGLPER